MLLALQMQTNMHNQQAQTRKSISHPHANTSRVTAVHIGLKVLQYTDYAEDRSAKQLLASLTTRYRLQQQRQQLVTAMLLLAL